MPNAQGGVSCWAADIMDIMDIMIMELFISRKVEIFLICLKTTSCRLTHFTEVA